MLETAQWLTLVTIVLGFLFQYLHATRQRRWDIEDRQYRSDQEKQEREKTAERLASVTIQEAARVSEKLAAEASKVSQAAIAEAKRVAAMVMTSAAEASHQAELAAADREKLSQAVKENTEISTKAFKEANSVNLKIEKLGIEHNDLQRERQDTTDKSEVIAETVLDTQERVKTIERQVMEPTATKQQDVIEDKVSDTHERVIVIQKEVVKVKDEVESQKTDK